MPHNAEDRRPPRAIRRRLGLLAAAGVLAVVARYVVAVVELYGPTSPLARHPVTALHAVEQALARDAGRLHVRVTRLLGPQMENRSVGVLHEGMTEADVAVAPREDRSAGDSVRILPGLLSAPEAGGSRGTPPSLARGDLWPHPGGDAWGRRRSALSAITPANVAELELVAEVDAEAFWDDPWVSVSQAAPVALGGLMFWITPGERLVAVELDTGRPAWSLRLPAFDYSRRGFAVDPEAAGGPTLFVPFGPFLAAVDARTGSLVPSFGRRGILELGGVSVVGPLVRGDELVVALYDPQEVIGLDRETGALRWRVALHPPDRSFGGGAAWSGMAVDETRGLLFVTTGNPRPALVGITRPGDNRNSNSVIAIDLETRAIRWSFQEVSHDLWDFDLPAAPQLATVTREGRHYDVVIAVTKIGNTLVLDRETGRPLHDFRLRRAPPSTFARDRTAEYQPDLALPEPLIELAFDASRITDVTPAGRASVERQVLDGRTIFGRFAPPALNRDHITFGLHGGAEWHGASIDDHRDRIFVPVNRIPWALRVYARTGSPELPPGLTANPTYSAKCAGCHLESRDGELVVVGEAAERFVPSLHAYTFDPANRDAFDEGIIEAQHPDLDVTQDELDDLWTSFEEWDRSLLEAGALRMEFNWRQLVDDDGLPGSAPPWGAVVALDLATGRKVWDVPLGEKEIGGRPMNTGTPIYGGLTSTEGGLLFVVGTDDRFVRALDQETGAELWRFRMAAAGSAPPITVEHDGRQYLGVVATGGKFHNYDARASRLYLFALPDD